MYCGMHYCCDVRKCIVQKYDGRIIEFRLNEEGIIIEEPLTVHTTYRKKTQLLARLKNLKIDSAQLCCFQKKSKSVC